MYLYGEDNNEKTRKALAGCYLTRKQKFRAAKIYRSAEKREMNAGVIKIRIMSTCGKSQLAGEKKHIMRC
jgi:hypothetical protein